MTLKCPGWLIVEDEGERRGQRSSPPPRPSPARGAGGRRARRSSIVGVSASATRIVSEMRPDLPRHPRPFGAALEQRDQHAARAARPRRGEHALERVGRDRFGSRPLSRVAIGPHSRAPRRLSQPSGADPLVRRLARVAFLFPRAYSPSEQPVAAAGPGRLAAADPGLGRIGQPPARVSAKLSYSGLIVPARSSLGMRNCSAALRRSQTTTSSPSLLVGQFWLP